MPEYIYENPDTKEQITVWQSVHEAHEYEVDGVAYDRVYTIPHASSMRRNCTAKACNEQNKLIKI